MVTHLSTSWECPELQFRTDILNRSHCIGYEIHILFYALLRVFCSPSAMDICL